VEWLAINFSDGCTYRVLSTTDHFFKAGTNAAGSEQSPSGAAGAAQWTSAADVGLANPPPHSTLSGRVLLLKWYTLNIDVVCGRGEAG
jgi:hypothetical protein